MNLPCDECNRNKNIVVIIILTLLILSVALVFFLNGFFISPPEITIEDIDLSEITLDQTKLDLTLLIDNKNPIGGKVKDLSFDVIWNNNGEENLIAYGEKKLMKIEANRKTSVKIPVDFYNKNIIPLTLTSLSEPNLNITVKGNAKIEFFLLNFNVPFEENITIETDPADIANSILKFIG